MIALYIVGYILLGVVYLVCQYQNEIDNGNADIEDNVVSIVTTVLFYPILIVVQYVCDWWL